MPGVPGWLPQWLLVIKLISIMQLPFLFYSFLASSLIYLLQFFIYKKKGNPTSSGSLSFAVIFILLAVAWTQYFESAAFVFVLIPVIGLVVSISQWRDTDFPKSLMVINILIHLGQVVTGIYFMKYMI